MKTSASAIPTDLAALLPQRAELGAWKPEAEPQVFKGEDLFVYIDGGADIYLEYGFVQVLVQDYRNPAGHGMSLEIFEMTSAESAFGIFTFKTGLGEKEIALGDEGRLADYYLNLRKGSLVVTITGLDQETAAEEELLILARAVESRIERGAPKPALAGRLPEEGLRRQSVKFFKGPLGLSNSDRLAAGSVFAFESGVKAGYDAGYSLILLEFRDEPAAAERFAESLKLFPRTKKLTDFVGEGRRFEGKDEKGTCFCAERRGRFICLVTGAGSTDQARDIIAGLAKNLKD